ncbi:MAG: WGR domain-containing protein [Myxococcaceae bacterium]
MSKRYFEFSEGTSNKFWEVWMDGNKVLTRYGKIGAGGQTTIKDEGSSAGAQKLYDKLIKEKTGKGYQEKGGGGGAAAADAPTMNVVPNAKKPNPEKIAKPAPAPAAKGATAVEPGFRRFEFVEGSSSKFWEVKVEGEQQIVRFGKIGTPGQTKEKDFDSAGEAKADTKKLIAEKTGKGYVEVGGKPKPEGNPELEAAIEKNLNDSAPYLVYADWLQSKGDPLGELIMLQTQKSPKAKDHLKKHAEAFLGPYAGAKKTDYGRGIEIEWQFGFMKSVKVQWDAFDYDTEDDAEGDLSGLLALPTARFIQSMTIGPIPGEDMMTLQPAVDVMEELKAPTTLRELVLGEIGDWDISGTETGDFDAVARLNPKLEKVTLHAGNIELGKGVELNDLVELNIETGGFDKGTLKNLFTLKAPKLKRLSIWFGQDNYGCDIKVKDLAPLLDNSVFPGLEHLGLMNSEFSDDIAAALVGTKRLKSLKSLDLSMGTLTDKGVAKMLEQKAAFAHLEMLELDDNALTGAHKKEAAALAKSVNYGKDHDPDRVQEDGYRYTSVGE